MTKQYMLVFSNPIEGKEDAYNRWYNEVHMPEVLEVSGFAVAQRFKISGSPMSAPEHKYLAIYEAPADQFNHCVEKLFAANGKMKMEDVIDLANTKVITAESITDLMTRK